jgi:hypothetical protein
MLTTPRVFAALAVACTAASAEAQISLTWCTVDGGGGTASSGPLSVGCTIGQPDAGPTMTGTNITITGGFWPGLPLCYANCDGSTATPRLNANDFQCFLNKYAAGDPYANCDGSTSPPTLNANDFQCFLNAYAAGCP